MRNHLTIRILSMIICSAMVLSTLSGQIFVCAEPFDNNEIETQNEDTEQIAQETESDTETSVSQDTETNDVEVVETETSTVKETKSEDDSDSEMVWMEDLDYILGRPMTDEEIEEQKSLEPDYLTELEEHEVEEYTEPMRFFSRDRAVNHASSYDSRDYHYITPVKRQNPWGSCWSFSVMAAAEANMLKNGITSTTDLSERHLLYFNNFTGKDELGNTSQDSMENKFGSDSSSNYLKIGGSKEESIFTLANWKGCAGEEQYPYSDNYASMYIGSSDASVAQDNVVHVRNVYLIPSNNMNQIKDLILEYGAVSASYYHNDNYYNFNTGAYFDNRDINTNHAITVVGWDDDYKMKNFNSSATPTENGAWIVKNSWGSDWGDSGYFYISYQDTSFQKGSIAAFEMENKEAFDHNYYHCGTSLYCTKSNQRETAECFKTCGNDNKNEKLSAVGITLASAGVNFKVSIYKDLKKDAGGNVISPVNGTFCTEQTGCTTYPGYYEIDLDNPVTLTANQTYSVVFSFSNAATVFCDTTHETDDMKYIDYKDDNESFFSTSESNYYVNNNDTPRIHAFTDNCTEIAGTSPTLNVLSLCTNGFQNRTNQLTWNKCENATAYHIYRSGEDEEEIKIATLSATNYRYHDVISYTNWNNTYSYRVSASYGDDSESISESKTDDSAVKPSITITSVDCSAGENIINWRPLDGASGYHIQRKEPNTETYEDIANITNGLTSSYVDTTATSDKLYDYRIQAYYCEMFSKWSTPVKGGADLSIQVISNKSVKLKWNVMTNAATYWLYCKGIQNYYILTNYTSYIWNSELQYGQSYNFYVLGKNEKEEIIRKTNTVTYTVPPENTTITSVDLQDNAVTVNWKKSEGALEYHILRGVSPDNMTEIGKVSGSVTNYSDSNAEKGKVYYYSIIPSTIKNGNSADVLYGSCTNVQQVYIPTAVTGVSALPINYNSIVIKWDKQSNISGYRIFSGKSKDDLTLRTTISSGNNSFTDIGLDTYTKYYYQIQAYFINGFGNTIYSDKSLIYDATPYLNKVDEVLTKLSQDESRVLLSWNSVPGASGYFIYRSKNNNDMEMIGQVDDLEFQDIDMEKGTIYSYQVCAYYSKNLCGALSNLCTVVTTPDDIHLSSLNLEETMNVKIKWIINDELVSYEIYRNSGQNTVFEKIADITPGVNSYIDREVAAGLTYSYKIIACKNSKKSDIKLSDAQSITVLPDKPELIYSNPITSDSVSIIGYQNLEYTIKNSCILSGTEVWESVKDETGIVKFNNLIPETKYYVFVRAENADDITVSSAIGGILCVETLKLPSITFSTNSIDLISFNKAKLVITPSNKDFNVSQMVISAKDQNNKELTILNQGTASQPKYAIMSNSQVIFTYSYDTSSVVLGENIGFGEVKLTVSWNGAEDTVNILTPVAIDKFVGASLDNNTFALKQMNGEIEENIPDGGIYIPYTGYQDSVTLRANVSLAVMNSLTWTVSDRRIASITENNDGTVMVTFKKPGCVKVHTYSSKTKTFSNTYITCVTTTPILTSGSLLLNTFSDFSTLEKVNCGTLYFVEMNQAVIRKITVESITKGSTTLDAEQFSITQNPDGGYYLMVNKEYLNSLNTGRYNLSLSVITGDSRLLAEYQDETKITHKISTYLQVRSVAPSVLVSTISINRLDKRVDSNAVKIPLSIRNMEYSNIKDITIPDNSNLYGKVEVIKDSGIWKLALTENVPNRYLSGSIEINIAGYQPIKKYIMIYLYENVPVIVTEKIPSVYLKYNEDQTVSENVSLYNKTDNELFKDYEIIESNGSDDFVVVKNEDGSLNLSINSYDNISDGQVLTRTLKVAPCDNQGNLFWRKCAQVTIKIKIYRDSLPKLTIANNRLILNREKADDNVKTGFTTTSSTGLLPFEQWKIYYYNMITRRYELYNSQKFKFSYNYDLQLLTIEFAESDRPSVGNYQYKIAGVVNGFEDEESISQTFSIKVISKTSVTIQNQISSYARSVIQKLYKQNTNTTEQSVRTPQMKILYKQGSNSMIYYELSSYISKNYNMTGVEVLSVPRGLMAAETKSGIIVRIQDRGLSSGTYTIPVRIYDDIKNKGMVTNIRIKVI